MRKSNDEYRLPTGEIVSVSQWDINELPEDAKLWNGYDYENQYWVHEGKRDMRTLEELRAEREKKNGIPATMYNIFDRI